MIISDDKRIYPIYRRICGSAETSAECRCTDSEQCDYCREWDARIDEAARDRSAAVEFRFYEGVEGLE